MPGGLQQSSRLRRLPELLNHAAGNHSISLAGAEVAGTHQPPCFEPSMHLYVVRPMLLRADSEAGGSADAWADGSPGEGFGQRSHLRPRLGPEISGSLPEAGMSSTMLVATVSCTRRGCRSLLQQCIMYMIECRKGHHCVAASIEVGCLKASSFKQHRCPYLALQAMLYLGWLLNNSS